MISVPVPVRVQDGNSVPLRPGVKMCTGDLLRKPNKLRGKLFHTSIMHRLGG